jgi:hypothetical protein
MTRDKIIAALSKPLAPSPNMITCDHFDPWADVISGIHGSYAEDIDKLMIAAMEAVRDFRGFQFVDQHGLAGEFALYVLSGHGLTDYGTSPLYAWVDASIADLWQPLIEKWKAYAAVVWEQDGPSR